MEEMYLPDLDNTPLSQALKDGIDWGMEDKVMVESPKLKQYFGVDTLLVQRISGRLQLYTNDEAETFPIHCSRTKFPPSLLDKALKGAENKEQHLRIYQVKIGCGNSKQSWAEWNWTRG